MSGTAKEKTYIAIDLKSFYASVECMDRDLDPLTTNLVVADESRTEKTICLAVSPSLKAYGIPGRARLFEAVEMIRQVNARRLQNAPGHRFTGRSFSAPALSENPALELDYIVARPKMAHYMAVSAQIYEIYLRYISAEDIHVYSIDEVFIDATSYLRTYGLTPKALAMKLVRAVLDETGITATAGIGPNLFLCKVAMDVEAKHIKADRDGVRIAELTEMSYREKLWSHTPLTDFWRVGRGISARLQKIGVHTMGDIARLSVQNEDVLYKMFGVNAELLIDHAWGHEPCTIAEIKAYRPENNSLSSGQVLSRPYPYGQAEIIVREMADQMALDMVDKCLVTDQIVLTVNYDSENLLKPELRKKLAGNIEADWYGRAVPKGVHGSVNLSRFTSASSLITGAAVTIFRAIADPELTVRRITVAANHVMPEQDAKEKSGAEQLSFFTDYEAKEKENEALAREKSLQKAVLDIKKKFGSTAIVKGLNLEEGATGIERSGQIGGHKA